MRPALLAPEILLFLGGLAVLMGGSFLPRTRQWLTRVVAAAVLLPLFLSYEYPWVLLVLLLIPACLMPSWLMLTGKKRKSLIPVLKQTGLINLAFSVLFAAGIAITTVLA